MLKKEDKDGIIAYLKETLERAAEMSETAECDCYGYIRRVDGDVADYIRRRLADVTF